MDLGKTITRLRDRKGLTQGEAAKLAGIPQSSFSQIENGETKNPRINTLINIARALGVSVCAILTDGRITSLEELPVSSRIKTALADPDFQEHLELALLMYENQVPASPLYPIILAFIKERKSQ